MYPEDYAKWKKPDKEKQIPQDFTYMHNLKNKTNEQTKQNRLIDTENKLVVAKKEGSSRIDRTGEGD